MKEDNEFYSELTKGLNDGNASEVILQLSTGMAFDFQSLDLDNEDDRRKAAEMIVALKTKNRGKKDSKAARTRNDLPREAKSKKLSYKEQKEYERMEKRILDAETDCEACRVKVEEPAVASDHLRLQEAYETLKDAERKVERLYARWAELEDKLA